MDLQIIAIILTALGLLGTIAGLVFALGKRDARFEALESRCKEDREKNSEQHKDFYDTRDSVTSINVTLAEFSRRMSNVEDDVKEVLRRLPRGES